MPTTMSISENVELLDFFEPHSNSQYESYVFYVAMWFTLCSIELLNAQVCPLDPADDATDDEKELNAGNIIFITYHL